MQSPSIVMCLGIVIVTYSDTVTFYSECFAYLAVAVFVMSFLLMGFNIISALIVTATVALIIVDMLGMMAWVGISLNAVSLVNLVMVSDGY